MIIHILYYVLLVRIIPYNILPIDDGSLEETVRLVQGLNQNDLPAQYRSGVCPTLDLTGEPASGTPAAGTPAAKPNPDSAVNAKPLSMFVGAFVTLVLLTLFNIV